MIITDPVPTGVTLPLPAKLKISPPGSASTILKPPVLAKMLCKKLPLMSVLVRPRVTPKDVRELPLSDAAKGVLETAKGKKPKKPLLANPPNAGVGSAIA